MASSYVFLNKILFSLLVTFQNKQLAILTVGYGKRNPADEYERFQG